MDDFDNVFWTGLPAGMTLQGRMVNPAHTKDGTLYPGFHGWTTIQMHTDPADCDHTETCCRDCVDSWSCDWDLRVAAADDEDTYRT